MWDVKNAAAAINKKVVDFLDNDVPSLSLTKKITDTIKNGIHTKVSKK